MRPWVVPVLLSLLVHAQAARELKWGWTSAGSLGQLTTTTGANSNAGLLSTVIPGSGSDAGVSNQAGVSGSAIAQPPLPPGMARPPALPGTPAYARQQAAERAAAAALAPAPASTVAEAAGAPTYVVYVGSAESASAPGFSPAGGPTSSMYAAQVGSVSNRAATREALSAPAPAPVSRTAGGLPNPFGSTNQLIWTLG